MNQIENIRIANIKESPLNPRKSFDESSLKELAESIIKQGLLQPITVRKVNKLMNEIVCGARRYKASVLAGLETIPCIVREMTDEEAFDAMITENLQRKDVAPMDEARAFFELHKRDVSFEELAARFGKSVQFIRLRIKLNDLIPELVDLLEKKELQISHALELCKLTVYRQTELCKDRYNCDGDNYYSWKFKPLSQIIQTLSSNFKDLEDAKFDKIDCETCAFRCGFNALFSEYNENKCIKPECFEDKTVNFRVSQAIEKSKEGYILLKNGKTQIGGKLEDLGYLVYDFKLYDWENPTTANAVRKEKEDGYLKAWVIGYFNEDCYKIVKTLNPSNNNPQAVLLDNSLKELQGKDKRNSEIKKEKIIEDVRTLMTESDFSSIDLPLTKIEIAAMYGLALRDSSLTTEIQDTFDKSLSYIDNCKNLNTPIQNRIVRSFIRKQSIEGEVTYSENIQSIILSVSKESYPDKTTRIELKHEDTYLKRKERIDEQIKSLS